MGQDDRNEGSGPGECIEHEFKLVGATVGLDGAFEEYECRRCPAESIVRSGDLPMRPQGAPALTWDETLDG